MGLSESKLAKKNGVNHDCPMCKLTGKPPNILGKFNIINDKEYKCNSCETIFKREFCEMCKKPYKIPNVAGSFFVIKNDSDCSCTK